MITLFPMFFSFPVQDDDHPNQLEIIGEKTYVEVSYKSLGHPQIIRFIFGFSIITNHPAVGEPPLWLWKPLIDFC